MSIQGFPNGPDSLSIPVPVSQGGTGGVTASAARSALSAASSGANSDITSLSSLTSASVRQIISTGSAPSVTAGSGLGTGGSTAVSVSGTDMAGTITLTTDVLGVTVINSDLVTLTFNTPYAAAPRVIVMPANAAACTLTLGVVQCLQSNVSTTAFKLKSGAVALPTLTAASYIFNYIAIQ